MATESLLMGNIPPYKDLEGITKFLICGRIAIVLEVALRSRNCPLELPDVVVT